jgi:hypothetical protein
MKDNSQEMIKHWNIWFTDNLLNYMNNHPDERLRLLFKPYASFSKMSNFFGLSNSYLQDKRKHKWAKIAIALSLLDSMKISIRKIINDWKQIHSDLVDELIKTEEDLIEIINLYEKLFNPKLSPFSWIKRYHPNLDLNYFLNIKSLDQAYWLGYLIADGWITLVRKPHANYYEIGFGQSKRDGDRVIKFSRALGLNMKYIKDKLTECAFVKSKKKSVFTVITFYSGNINDKNSMANNLINLGMNYIFDANKGMRKKVPNFVDLGDKNLMLAYLLGFYDGDGTRAYNQKDGRICPSIASSVRSFLMQIKKYFNIKNTIQKTTLERYDFNRNIFIRGTSFKLNLGHDLFKMMMSINVKSLKRKRIPLESLNRPKMTAQRKWLAEIFTEEELDSLLDVISPTKTSELLGIHRETLVSFAKDVYGLNVPSGSYYNQLATYEQHYGKDIPFFSELNYWTNYLCKVGKYSNRIV